jgi:chromosome segregation ATPase
MFNLFGFKTQSGLLGSKKDKLEGLAAEASKLRIDYEKQSKVSYDLDRKKADLQWLEKRMEQNENEIERRRSEIIKLNNQEQELHRKISGIFEGEGTIHEKIQRNKEMQKKLQNIMAIKRHHDSEIDRLWQQNDTTSRKIKKL